MATAETLRSLLLVGGLAGALLGVDLLDVLTLVDGALVGPEAVLGEFVDALVGGGSSGLDHVEDAALVRGEAGDLARDLAAEGDALGDALRERGRGDGKGGGERGGG